MFNIYFKRNGRKDCTQVIASISTDLPVERNVLLFNFECINQYSAALLQEYLQEKLESTLEKIRKTAYQKGLKDGRGKKRTLTIFTRAFDSKCVGW